MKWLLAKRVGRGGEAGTEGMRPNGSKLNRRSRKKSTPLGSQHKGWLHSSTSKVLSRYVTMLYKDCNLSRNSLEDVGAFGTTTT